ncbi:AAA family ATPase [Patescibacteria group bacterium]
MNFKELTIKEWQQFQDVEIKFHDRLTILTGANGSGKTTILGNILARHFGWEVQSCSTPKKDKKTGVISFLTRLFNGENKNDSSKIGYILYDNDQKASLRVPDQNSAQYQLQILGQQGVQCFFIPSHRSVFRYHPVNNIPFGKKDKRSAFQEVSNATKDRYLGGNNQPSSFLMKNTLIGWAYQGYRLVDDSGKEINARDSEQVKFYEGFKNVLRKILPKTLGFEDFEIREREIVFICNKGKDEFVLEQASGGVSALIDIAWQIYMYSTVEKTEFTVIIDEIENHLHPTMQRRILPDLLDSFPEARFVVSTHSPLVVGSVQDSNVFVFKYNDNGKIVSQELDLINQAKTATEILTEVLGVSFTMPIWAEDKLMGIVEKYSSKRMTKGEFSNMRRELDEIGLGRLMPEAVYKLMKIDNDKD